MRESLHAPRSLTGYSAPARFEKVAAKHHRIEAERKALQEALTDAQLVLSLQHRKPLAEVRSLKVSSTRKTSGKPEEKDRCS